MGHGVASLCYFAACGNSFLEAVGVAEHGHFPFEELDIRKEDIRRALSDFEGVEHRLEHVETINGARWVNDSKATNVGRGGRG